MNPKWPVFIPTKGRDDSRREEKWKVGYMRLRIQESNAYGTVEMEFASIEDARAILKACGWKPVTIKQIDPDTGEVINDPHRPISRKDLLPKARPGVD